MWGTHKVGEKFIKERLLLRAEPASRIEFVKKIRREHAKIYNINSSLVYSLIL